MKILLVNDVGPVRRVLDIVASADAQALEIQSVGDAASAEAALSAHPDIRFVLVDLDGDAPAALAAIKRLNAMAMDAAFVGVSSDTSRGTVIGAINAGASAFIDKRADIDALTDAVRAVLAATIQLPPTILERRGSDRPGFGMWTPSPRAPEALGFATSQVETLRLLMLGKSKDAMSQMLGKLPADVDADVVAVLRQLSADGRLQAVLTSARSGLRFGCEREHGPLTERAPAAVHQNQLTP